MEKRNSWIWVILVVALAALLRLYQIDRFPAGLNLDETSQGYTAYSILKTGKDEWGVFLPLAPRAFGDYRSPLYTYLLVPFIAVLGLNALAVRLPAALLGSLAVLTTYLLVAELFKDGVLLAGKKISPKTLALFSALFLAISPWHISLSRGAFEASLNAFLFPLGLWLFLKGLKKWPYFLGTGLVFGLNLFSYYSPRFFTPLSILILWLFFKKNFFVQKRALSSFFLFGIFFLLSFYTLLVGGKTRVADTSLLNATDSWQEVADRQYEAAWYHFPTLGVKVFNNKIIALGSKFYKQYLSYFSFDFLFLEGASEATYGMIPGRGVLYLFELPLVLLTIFSVIRSRDKRWWLILTLLLLSALPAALAKGSRAANRAVTMIPFWQILSAAGMVYFLSITSRKISRTLVFGLAFIILGFSLLFFLEDYFYHAPRYNASSMAYGWHELADYLKKNADSFDKIVISGKCSEPQIALAFHLKMDPEIVQEASKAWLEYEQKGLLFVDQLEDYSLGKFEFKNLNFPADSLLPKTLFIGREEDFWGDNGKVEKVIYYPGPQKKVAFKLVTFAQ